LFLYNVTNSSYDVDGQTAYSFTDPTVALLKGKLVLTGTTTFELRHWTQSAKSGDGLGLACDNDPSNPQSNEVYSQIEIIKLR
jgi:hypothetical protein